MLYPFYVHSRHFLPNSFLCRQIHQDFHLSTSRQLNSQHLQHEQANRLDHNLVDMFLGYKLRFLSRHQNIHQLSNMFVFSNLLRSNEGFFLPRNPNLKFQSHERLYELSPNDGHNADGYNQGFYGDGFTGHGHPGHLNNNPS